MSTSILYHTFGVRGHHYIRTEYGNGATVFHIEKALEKQWCRSCQSREVIKKGTVSRLVQTLPVGKRQVRLLHHLHRLKCRSCGAAVKLEPLLIAAAKRHYTHSPAHYIRELFKWMTLKDIAQHPGLHWNTVRDIVKEKLKRQLKRRSLHDLKYLWGRMKSL